MADVDSSVPLGYINILGKTHNISSGNIKGFDVDYTINNYNYLPVFSDDLETYTFNGWPGEFSSNSIPNHSSLTDNTPLSEVTFPVSGFNVNNFHDDFYYRIHLSLYSINLGYVLSEQIHYVNIWNSFLTTKTLTTIDTVGLENVTYNLAEILPYNLKPLEELSGYVQVLTEGVASLNGYISFTTDANSPILDISGNRAVFWPYPPLRDYKETRQYLTNIISAKSAEDRHSIRDTYRSILSYDYIFLNYRDFSEAKIYADRAINLPLAVPLWSDVVKVTNLTIGQTVISFDTTPFEYILDGIVCFWKSAAINELQEVIAITDTEITLKSGLTQDFAECYVVPVRVGIATTGITFKKEENHKKYGSLEVIVDDNYYLSVWNKNTFLSLPIIENPAIISGGIDTKIYRELEIFDSISNGFSKFDTESYNRQTRLYRARFRTIQDLYTFRREMDYFRGKFLEIYLPTFEPDLEVVEDIGLNSTFIKVNFVNLAQATVYHVQLVTKANIVYNIEVNSYTNLSPTVDRIELEANFPATIPVNEIKRLSFIHKVRLDTDSITYERKGGDYLVDLPVKQLNG